MHPQVYDFFPILFFQRGAMSTADILKIFGINFGVTAVLFILVQVLLALWLKARLEGAIRHEYDRKLEDYRRQQDRRERAAAIAELFTEWIAREDKKKLNRLAWEAALWLPPDIVRNITKRLANAPDAEDVRQIIITVRRHLLGADDDLTFRDIVYFQERK
jgi:hypothetical protein